LNKINNANEYKTKYVRSKRRNETAAINLNLIRNEKQEKQM